MREIRAQLCALADVPWPVRIEGPTGCGKSLAARLLHDLSTRANGPFVACNVGMIAAGLEIGELVGHTRGAFTGAVTDRVGVFEAANGGTLFLDEIGTASPTVQRALLRLVEEKAVRRVGEHRDRLVNVHLVFATNTNLEAAVVAGEFRCDLYYRLGNFVVRMPALARHREDIPELAHSILQRKALELGCEVPELSGQDMDLLMQYDWPGNVRELEHMLEHRLVFGKLPLVLPRSVGSRTQWREHLADALRRHNGNKTAAAQELGISRNTLYKELRNRCG